MTIPTTAQHIVITVRDGIIEFKHVTQQPHHMPLAYMYREGRKWIGDDMGFTEMAFGGKRAVHAFCLETAIRKSDFLKLTWGDDE